MTNTAYGIGGFMEGLADGYYTGRQMNRKSLDELIGEKKPVVPDGQPAATTPTAPVTPTTAPAPQGTGGTHTSAYDPSKAPVYIRDLALKNGISPDFMTRTAWIESRFDPSNMNKSSGAAGLFQVIPSTAKRLGLSNPLDGQANTEAAVRHTLENQKLLTAALGRNPTDQELYLAHQQGGAGARALLSNPDRSAVEVLAPFYKSHKDPTGMNTATQAIVGNGGRADMTSKDFAGYWANKWDSYRPVAKTSTAGTPTALNGAQSINAPAGASGGIVRLPDGREDMSNLYNTVLDPVDEAKFQAWAKRIGKDPAKESADYDLRGAWNAGAGQAGNGHFPDTFKKPNHPTFSDQSQYSGKDGYVGGKWTGDDKSATFTPSASNLKNMPADMLQKYFNSVEPNSRLILPNATAPTAAAPTTTPKSIQTKQEEPKKLSAIELAGEIFPESKTILGVGQ